MIASPRSGSADEQPVAAQNAGNGKNMQDSTPDHHDETSTAALYGGDGNIPKRQPILDQAFMRELYFEDISTGEKLTVGTHTADREGMVEFARIWDPQVFHTDEEAAAHHNGLIASSSYTLCVVTRVIGLNLHIMTFGVMEYKEITVHAPVRPEDVLTVIVEWLEKRSSRSKPDRGVVHARVEVRNQRDEPALSYIASIMMMKREK